MEKISQTMVQKSLGGDMVTQLGATLANPDASTAGKEDIIAANPDVIFCCIHAICR